MEHENDAGDALLQERAAEWVARRHGGLRPEEESELQRWLAADPAHAAAFAEHALAWAFINQPRETGVAEVVQIGLAKQKRNRRRRVRLIGFAAAGLAAAAVVMLALVPLSEPNASLSPTVVVRPNVQVLPDGSRVELNASAAISVEFSPDERKVLLLQGEALFEVEKNPDKPFIVIANGVHVRAVGTAFSVRFGTNQVGVLVTEGKVRVDSPELQDGLAKEVAPLPESASPDTRSDVTAFLVAGQHAQVMLAEAAAGNRLRIATLSHEELERELAWRGRRVEFTDTTLSEAILVFNRHNQVQISIHDSPLNDRRITGLFWADDPEGFARLLESGMNVEVQRLGDQIVLHTIK